MKNNFNLLFGERIKDIRKKRGMTQEELAWKSGVSLNFVGQIERGQKQPSIKTVRKIADTLEVAPSVFFEKTTYVPQKEDLVTKKIQSLLKEGSEEDKKIIYRIVKSLLVKNKK